MEERIETHITADASGEVSSKTGIVLKCIGGFYYVMEDADDPMIYECRARGKFRLDGVAPRAGDRVRFEIVDGKQKGGYLVEIFPRSRMLTRPPVANVTQFVLVLSASKPHPDFLLADKLLVQAERCKVRPIIVINKCDIAEADLLSRIQRDYSGLSYRFLMVSAKNGDGLDELRSLLSGEISCLAGQSAVGKTSLLNALCQRLQLETGGLSRKTGRGRHTTRVAELLPLEGDSEGFVMDTPGFSLLSLEDMEPEELQDFYPEMRSRIGQCRFDNCLHQNEPNCAVKQAVNEDLISRRRYDSYLLILAELTEEKRRRYS